MDKILVPEEIRRGLDAFRAEYPDQMGYVTFSISKMREMGLENTADWVDRNRTAYSLAVERGWEPIKPMDREDESLLAEQLYEINKEAEEKVKAALSGKAVKEEPEESIAGTMAEIAAEYEVGKQLIIETEATPAPRKRGKKQ